VVTGKVERFNTKTIGVRSDSPGGTRWKVTATMLMKVEAE